MIHLEAVEAAPRGGSKSILGPLTLSIEPGTPHLIVGANGAGKTTLLRVLAGLAPALAGRVRWDGIPGAAAVASAAAEHGVPLDTPSLWPHVAALFETPDPQFLAETVSSDIAFGLEGSALSAREIRERVEEALDSYGLLGFRDRDPRTLSAGEKARALLAAAHAARPSCMLLDQTLAHLDPGSRRALEARLAADAKRLPFALIRTHQEAEPPFPGERFHVLDQGRLCDAGSLSAEAIREARALPLPLALRASASLKRRGVWSGPLVADTAAFAGRWSGRAGSFPGDPPAESRAVPAGGTDSARRSGETPAFHVHGLAWSAQGSHRLFDDFTLLGRRGEIVALVGRSGSGKSSLLKLISGIQTPDDGMAWRASRAGGRGREVALALEYPERQLIGRTVLEDVGLGLWVDGVPRPEREYAALRALEAVGLSADRFAARVPSSLSEGEKRRAALAGLLAEPAPLLLLDEPTAGLDPEGRRALRAALDSLRSRRQTVVIASHDLEFVHAVADRVVLLARDGDAPTRIVTDGAPALVFRDERGLADAGIPAPDVVVLFDALRRAGVVTGDPPRDGDGLVARIEDADRERLAVLGAGSDVGAGAS